MDDSATRELKDLLSAEWDDRLDEASRQRLEALISKDDYAGARAFVDFTRMHLALEYLVSSRLAHRRVINAIAQAATVRASISRRRRVRMLGLAAASLLVAAFFALQRPVRHLVADAESSNNATPAEQAVIGSLTPLAPDSRWSFGSQGDRQSPSVRLGDTLSVDVGAVTLRLRNNVIAQMRAPAVLHLHSVDNVRLLHGRIHVDVPDGAEGFIVDTAAAEIRDLGTSFSVETVDGSTDVVVHQGEVDLTVARAPAEDSQHSASAKRFREGEAVRVDVDGTLSRIVTVRSDAMTSEANQPAKTLITSVSDNLTREGMWSFYEIAPGGLSEDAKAFVDRRHEWNGATVKGLPDYLVGADYVKTFNDDKITPDLVIELELDGAAEVYVFLDNRLTPPPWLVKQFSETGDTIGIDESGDELAAPLGVGPGVSIDQTLSVWRLVATHGGIVSLGPNGTPVPHHPAPVLYVPSNMYGIAVTRLGDAGQ
jgi:ferric-dicitrate binding protein FerR (iron transport regulator)